MDLLQLEHFLAVAEERTFTRAAERVCRTQPAVSQSIKKLEDEVGTSLFARDIHDVSLTEAGRLLMDHARRMVNDRDTAMRQIAALNGLRAGTLAIAAHESAALYLLPGPIHEYVRQFPEIRIGIYRSRLTEIPRQVLDRDVHVGFVKDEPTFRELHSVEVHSDDMVLIASPRHALARRGAAGIRELGSERFIVHHLRGTTEQQILRMFEQHSTPCRVVAELWSFENIKNFVRAEVGIAIVPRITVRQEISDRLLVEIRVPELSIVRRTLMIYRDHGYLSDAARELIKIVRSFSWNRAADAASSTSPRPERASKLSAVPAPKRRVG
ncbi:MAG TPA: LysR family transcriptional regulator [Vicinamibacterales bacterium]|jgi:DNA-binding transcriptional LysR family regulator|nr:LysR family transcriptional regulator [Vicinamibacterales bacterium]